MEHPARHASRRNAREWRIPPCYRLWDSGIGDGDLVGLPEVVVALDGLVPEAAWAASRERGASAGGEGGRASGERIRRWVIKRAWREGACGDGTK